MDNRSDETAEALMTAASQAGHRITPVMLKKWRAAGLLPRPSQRSRGRGHGTETVYPAGSTGQLLRLLEIRAEGGRFDPERTLWRLWWEGWPVNPEHIWTRLDTTFHAVEAWRVEWRTLTPDERIERTTMPDRLPEPLRTIRKRVGPRGVESVAYVLSSVAVGEFSTWEHGEDKRAIIDGLGFDRAKRERIGRADPWLRGLLDEQLRDLATTIQPSRVRDALASTCGDELCRARDELQAFLGFLYTVRLTMDSMLGAGALGLGLLPEPSELTHETGPGLLLVWLAWRRIPQLYDGYTTLMRLAESGAPISFFINLIRNANPQELPRRLAPSGSAADGKEPSTCTTSLSPSPSPNPDTVSSA